MLRESQINKCNSPQTVHSNSCEVFCSPLKSPMPYNSAVLTGWGGLD